MIALCPIKEVNLEVLFDYMHVEGSYLDTVIEILASLWITRLESSNYFFCLLALVIHEQMADLFRTAIQHLGVTCQLQRFKRLVCLIAFCSILAQLRYPAASCYFRQ